MKNVDLFYDYFKAQHGTKEFNRIKNMILENVKDVKHPVEKYMSRGELLNGYVMIVFEIALTEFWGMNDEEATNYMKMMLGENLLSKDGLKQIKEIHKDAILEIQYHFSQVENEDWEMEEDEKIINLLFNNKLNNFSTGKWKRKDKEYKKAIENFYEKMNKLDDFTDKKLTEEEKEKYIRILEDAKDSIYDLQFEEKRLFYIEGYKDGVSSMKEILGEI